MLALIGGGGYLASRQLYFLGTNGQGTVVVYRGFPYVLPLGIPMYETFYVSGVPASTIPADRRGEDPQPRDARPDQRDPAHQRSRARQDQQMRARNRELFGLIPASLLISAGFAAVFIQRSNQLSNVSLVYGAVFLGLCVVGHIFIRVTLPHADPYIFPLVAVLACFGIVMVYRIDGATLARQQAQWFVVGLLLFAGTVIVFRDYRKLENYRYLIVIASIVLMALPRVPGLECRRQRRLPGDSPRLAHLPADRVRQGRPGHLPGQLPAGPPPSAGGRAQDPRATGSRRSSTWGRCCCCGASRC